MGNIRGGMNGFLGTIGQPTAQVIDGSLKFNSASSQYLSSTSTFQNTKSYEMTFSFWLKRCAPTAVKATQYIFSTNVEGTIFFDSGNSDKLSFNLRGSSGSNFFTTTNAELRDYNAWYHVVVALNLGSGTQSQRFKCYINNVEQTMSNTSFPSNAYHTGGNWYIGAYGGGPSHFPDYYLSNFYCISGQTLDPSYFGFTDPQTNTWRPKKYTGTFTFDNSFYLPLDNEDDFGKDKSGEENHFTQNNFSGTSINPDIVKDSPSGAVFGGRAQTGITTTSSAPANYATLNPLASINVTLSNGNLESTRSSDLARAHSTIAVSSGKWYAEMVAGQDSMAGISLASQNPTTYPGGDANSYGYQRGGNKYNNGSNTSYGSAFTTGDLIGVALDLDGGTLTFYKNGISQGIAYSGLSGTFVFAGRGGQSSTLEKWNFGQKPFKYAPPQGFLPLNSATVRPNKVIARPDQYVGVSLWTGDGNTGRNIKTLQFKPDLVWIKQRSATRAHAWFDSVRGANKRLQSSTTNAETTHTDQMSAFIDNGFTVEDNNTVNVNSGTYVGWSWRAGGNKNTFNVDDVGYASAAAAGLDGGTATVTGASVGTKQGFSIIKFHTAGTNSGATIPHGLSKSPDFIVAKALNATLGWKIYHSSLGNDYFLEFDTDAQYNVSNYWGVTSSVFEADASGDLDLGSPGCISYCWHDIPGLQKFGSFEGTGNSDGPYIELGFKPAVVIYKNADETEGWGINDTTRSPDNPSDEKIEPNTGSAEASITNRIDLLSTGFKIRAGSAQAPNESGDTYIYAAWAEAPASNLFGGQSNAR